MNPAMAAHLERARRQLSPILDGDQRSLRALRMAAGLSQAKLAERAKATQSYVARVEAGTLDPGTDMLMRLADALGVSGEIAFSAVQAQRRQQHE